MNYQPYSKLILAYSGGVDSHVLLHQLVHHAAIKAKLQAVHINHALSPHADQWQAHCATTCAQLDVPFIALKINIEMQAGDSLEAVAREQRYAELAKFVDANTALLTAQHQDDQAETILLQLLRGAGIKGLAAMPAKKCFGQGVQLRPLLNSTRAELLQYAHEHNLHWLEDESNQNQRFNRNYLRQTVMPLLRKRWPQMAVTLARSSEHCAEAAELITELAKLDYQSSQMDKINHLNLTNLISLPRSRQKNLLRYWLQLNNIRAPNRIHLQKILDEVAYAKPDATPLFTWDNIHIQRLKSHEQGTKIILLAITVDK